LSASRSAARRTQRERDALVEQYLPLVRYVVGRLPVTMPATLDRDDFWSAGVTGLLHAAERWSPERGASFKTFAYTAIRGAILDEIRRHDPVPRARRERLRRLERTADDLKKRLGRPPALEEIAEAIGADARELDEDLLALATCRTLSFDDVDAGNLGQRFVFDADSDPAHRADLRDRVEHLARCIEELPEPDRQVVVLYHHEGLYLKEIGAILGVSESRVSQILSRATARLRLRADG